MIDYWARVAVAEKEQSGDIQSEGARPGRARSGGGSPAPGELSSATEPEGRRPLGDPCAPSPICGAERPPGPARDPAPAGPRFRPLGRL
ncbi:unnamed protein product [Rangifer tarandus platyrhynchus]|uniref:Uncharacterized protein n=1 Tax=Rangifer tarandus platyrhynchus TaxID=3082113 RepID=A0AC59Z8Q3_RANTA